MARRNPLNSPASIRKAFADIARKRLFFDTLDVRRSDSLDFREVFVGSVEDALADAFNLGVEFATGGQLGRS
jgi:hypothetical protein